MKTLYISLLAASIAVFLAIASSANAADTSGPNITLNSPTNGTTSYYNNTNFTYTPVDEGRVMWCSLYLNSSFYTINHTVTNNTANLFTDILVPENGTYIWYVSCSDNSSNSRNSPEGNFIVSVDKTAPTVTLDAQNSSSNQSGVAAFYYTAVDMASGLNSCKLIVDGALKSTGTPTNATKSSFSVALPYGTYTWSVNCTDNNGNERASDPALIMGAEASSPVITVVSPSNNSVYATGLANFSYIPSSDENFSHCKLMLNKSIKKIEMNLKNRALNSFSNVELKEGPQTWSINCTSASGKETATNIYNLNVSTLSLVSNFLVVKPNSPEDNYRDTTGTPSFVFTASSASRITSCELLTNNSVRAVNREVSNAVQTTFSNIDMADGIWTWRVRCKNEKTLVISTPLRTIKISKTFVRGAPVEAPPPQSLLETPQDKMALNETIPPATAGAGRTIAVILLIGMSAAFSLFVFFAMQPKYRRAFASALGLHREMAKEQLKFYIDQNLRKGVSEERIRRHLRNYNWGEHDIDISFKEVYNEMKAELKVKKGK